MATNTILDQAEQRAQTVGVGVQSWRAQLIRIVREKIGEHNYEMAKHHLPIQERAIQTELQPFLDRVVRIAQKAKRPVPQCLQKWLNEINHICIVLPQQLRQGIATYEQIPLEYLLWKGGGGRTLDVNYCAAFVSSTQQFLRSYDGLLEYARGQKAQAESWIEKIGWPEAFQEIGPVMASSPQQDAPLKVNATFSLDSKEA